MARMCLYLTLLCLSSAELGTVVPLTTFDGSNATTQTWTAFNDPVMGGGSVSSFKVDGEKKIGIFDGEVKLVPLLRIPGFATMRTDGKFPDISEADALQLVVRSSIPYKSWKVEFGPAPKASIFNFAPSTYKSDFKISGESGTWQTITVPFNEFSYKWSSTTGEATTKCSDDPSVCPDKLHLSNLSHLEIAAEGLAGKFHLEVKSISAVKTNLGALVV
eukprot:TRINITY_DN27394_c0_g1_i1.p1 TRINITY_DN27394_c0_g1~~TRINITY_DN27394_c0_g1_i1.p1  ORF type:complete len:218 (-),score=39.87 TRINITY_DN27394_c0_g1_i1:345-998(-)